MPDSSTYLWYIKWVLDNVTGINVEWLKHETGHKYELGYIHLNPIADDLAYCASLNPQEYFFTVDKKQLHVGIVAQISKYRFEVLATGVSLDFWTWVDSHWAISRFYYFLKGLSDPWHDIPTVFLPTRIDRQLYDGEIHFISALRNQNDYAVGFLYDLLDLEDHRLNPRSPSKVYGISSLRKIQDYFRRYINHEQERKQVKNRKKDEQ